MTETLAVEWARFNINVNAIAPGAFESEMMDGMVASARRHHGAFPRKRMGDPSAARQHAAVPALPGVRVRHRHRRQGRRRTVAAK